MASTRRIGVGNAETRSALLDAAERLMCDEGYAAVTSRKLGKTAGLSPQIVYYYFETMDDLFEAVFERVAEYYLVAIEEVSRADQPLLAMWQLSSNPARATVISELMALANHRKGLNKLIQKFSTAFTTAQTEIVQKALSKLTGEFATWPPMIIALILENVARGIVFAEGYDLAQQSEVRDFITKQLQKLVTPD